MDHDNLITKSTVFPTVDAVGSADGLAVAEHPKSLEGEDPTLPIPGLEGRYSACADGRIWSHIRSRWLKPSRRGSNYLGVTIAGHTHYVHRLVAMAWHPNPDCLPLVNHLDGDKRHNAASNLEWCTLVGNRAHAVRTGLRKIPVKNEHLSKREKEVMRLVCAGLRGKEIARHLSRSVKTIEKHYANVLFKLGVQSITHAAVLFDRAERA